MSNDDENERSCRRILLGKVYQNFIKSEILNSEIFFLFETKRRNFVTLEFSLHYAFNTGIKIFFPGNYGNTCRPTPVRLTLKFRKMCV